MAAKWMVRSSPNCIASMFPYFEGLLKRWEYLDEAIVQGKTPLLAWDWLDQNANGWEEYNAAMLADARMTGEEIVARVKLPAGARRLLDLGGGHGLHAVNFCRSHPELAATVLDWPQVRAIAEATIAAEEMEGRVEFREGDFWTAELGTGYDVALLFNIVHMYDAGRNLELLRRVASALNPGGVVVIMDQMAMKASGPTARATAALVGLDLFVEVNGQTYPPDEIAGWLAASGFTATRSSLLAKSPGFGVVTATRVHPGG
jgi:cyclopropane fatty-acyl-phospholipid synthase-like methyltransferase